MLSIIAFFLCLSIHFFSRVHTNIRRWKSFLNYQKPKSSFLPSLTIYLKEIWYKRPPCIIFLFPLFLFILTYVSNIHTLGYGCWHTMAVEALINDSRRILSNKYLVLSYAYINNIHIYEVIELQSKYLSISCFEIPVALFRFYI